MFANRDLGAADVRALLARAGFDVRVQRPSRRTLLDTFDGRLHAARLRLELRDDDLRELILSEGGSPPAHVAVEAEPTFAADLPPGPFGGRLSSVIGVRALLPIVTVTAQRSVAVRRDAQGKNEVAVVVDDQIGVDGARLDCPTWVVSLDELEGYAKAAQRATRLLVSFGLSECGADILGMAAVAKGVDLHGYDGSPTVPLERGESAGAGFRRVLANLANDIDANWVGSVGDIDPEFLHDLRVAVRRTRSVLAEGKGVFPAAERVPFQSEFAWLGRATGGARDLDVHVIGWDAAVRPLGPSARLLLEPVRDHISGLRRIEHANLAAVLRSDRYRDLIDGWRTWLAAGDASSESDRPLGGVVADRFATNQRRLVGKGRKIGPGSPPEDLHALRKETKKLRYLLECFGGVFASKPRRAFLGRLKSLQDNLGEHQDTEVHAAQLLAVCEDLPLSDQTAAATLLAVGRLTEHLDRRRQAARDAFARRFADYDSKQTRRNCDDLLRSVSGS
ncbi:MAG: CHAD domain-containing protein [Acidimicrobiales bacterium]